VECENYEMIVLPGGMPGASNINGSSDVDSVLKSFKENGKYIAAICAAPYVLAEKGLLNGCMATSYPSFKEKVEIDSEYKEERVVVDGNIITSRGPATAAEFAFKLVELLKNKECSDKIRKSMLFCC
jgi:4-methyl-5(b-hydroxyethyl)-thiazole monophosphate biosynthesis